MTDLMILLMDPENFLLGDLRFSDDLLVSIATSTLEQLCTLSCSNANTQTNTFIRRAKQITTRKIQEDHTHHFHRSTLIH